MSGDCGDGVRVKKVNQKVSSRSTSTEHVVVFQEVSKVLTLFSGFGFWFLVFLFSGFGKREGNTHSAQARFASVQGAPGQ